MFQLILRETSEALSNWLKTNGVKESTEPVFALSCDEKNKIWQLSDAMWQESAAQKKIDNDQYLLTSEKLIEFLETHQPKILLSKIQKEIETQAIEAVKAVARAVLYPRPDSSKKPAEDEKAFMQRLDNILKEKNIEKDDLFYYPGLQQWVIQLPHTLLTRMAEYDPTKPTEMKLFAVAAMMDSIWMAQNLGTNIGLSHGGHVGALLASNTAAAGIAFAAATGVAMGVACGLVSASIYEKHAVAKFQETHGKEPSAKERELIKADAKIFGIGVFANITGWTLGVTVMQIALSVASLHPVGIVFNVVASVCAGAGQAIGAGLAFWHSEKAKFMRENNGEFDEKKWQDYRNKTGFVKKLVVTSLVAFVSGFAWNMVGTYLPAPIQKIVQHAKEPIKKAVDIVITAVVSLCATFFALWVPHQLFSKPSAVKRDTKQQTSVTKSKKGEGEDEHEGEGEGEGERPHR